MRIRRRWAAVLPISAFVVFVFSGASGASAQSFGTVGVRAAGMAGAFVAVADDASAVYWNPAGLADGRIFSLVIDRQTAEADGLRDDESGGRAGARSGALVALATPALGLGYYRLRETDVSATSAGGVIARSLITHHAGVTLVQSLTDHLAVGTTLKVVRGVAVQQAIDPKDVRRPLAEVTDAARDLVGRASHAFDLDVGLIAYGGPVRAGLVMRNVRRPSFAADLTLERQVRGGLAFLPDARTTIALDADLKRVISPFGPRRDFAAGVERTIGSRLIARGGVRVNTLGPHRAPAASVGGSVTLRSSIWLEGVVTRGGRSAESGWGLGARVAF